MRDSIAVVLAGFGGVGRAFTQYLKQIPEFSLKAILRSDTEFIDLNGIAAAEDYPFKARNLSVAEIMRKLSQPMVFVDATADASMINDWKSVLIGGNRVVSANKLPLCATLDQSEIFYNLETKIGIEATVGAGLPIIRTIRTALDSGDRNISFEGCFSGTLAYVFDALKQGCSFSEAVLEASKRGYTEADPREDLGANDLARKALILNRTLGGKLELDHIKIQSLLPKAMQDLTLEQFMDSLDQLILPREASQMNSPRFRVRGDVSSAQVEMVDEDLLQPGMPTDNDFCMRSQAYPDGLRIFGPGAGPTVTAMGLIADLISIPRANCQIQECA